LAWLQECLKGRTEADWVDIHQTALLAGSPGRAMVFSAAHFSMQQS
jgi:hypothetical protein